MVRQDRQKVVGFICAVVAVAAVFAYTATVRSEAQTQRTAALSRYGGERAQVVISTAEIAIGQEVTASDVAVQDWLVDLLPSGRVATSLDQLIGRVAQADIKKNEPILLERVGDGSARITVPDGLEAVSVPSDDVLAVGGAIKAGSLVDIYVETSEGKIILLGQRILVLETSGSNASEEKADKIAWVTLAVMPESVSELISASARGTIHLVLPSSSLQQGGQS